MTASRQISRAALEAAFVRLVKGLRVPAPTPGDQKALLDFAEELVQWNRTHNLVGSKGAEDLMEVLFADALVLAGSDFLPADAHLVDVGAGAGVPVIPLLILRPDLHATLVEPRKKRVAFMRIALGAREELQSRAQVLAQRLEAGSEHLLGTFDVALSRATFAKEEWVELGAKLAPRVVVFAAQEAPPEGFTATTSYRLLQGAPRTLALYQSP